VLGDAEFPHGSLDVSLAHVSPLAGHCAGFEEAVVANATDLPPNLPAATVTIPKTARTAALALAVPRTVPRGIYTFLVRGTGAYPFSKDPKAKPKPNVSLTVPSNPITITVR
jgi:hypothetical protein